MTYNIVNGKSSLLKATQARLEAIPEADEALAALAIAIAREMDNNPTAALAKEYRETIKEILARDTAEGKAQERLNSLVENLKHV